MRPGVSLFLALLLVPVSVLAEDITPLRDRLLASDPSLAASALEEAAALKESDRRLLVMSLIGPLRRDPESARAAAQALRCCRSTAEVAIPDLVEALRYDDPAIAAEIGTTLVKIGPASVKPLIRALQDPNFILRQRAATVLSQLGPESRKAAPALAECLLDAQNQVQIAAEEALLKMGDPAVDAVKDELKRADSEGRKTLVTFLGRLGPAASPVLIQRLREDPSASVRISAVTSLAGLQPPAPGVVPAMVDCLKHSNEYLRFAAINALGQMGPAAQSAIGPLIASSQRDTEALARQRSAQALEGIGRASKESLAGLVANLKDSDANVRRLTVIALSESDVPPAEISALLAISVKDGAEAVRLQAIQAAAAIASKDPGAVGVLKTALFDPIKSNRYAAIAAMGEATSDPATAALALEEPLKSIDINARNACIQSLARLGPAAVPVLLRQMLDSYAVLRDNAEQAILAMGPDAIPALEKARATADPFLQKKIPSMIARLQGGSPSQKTP